MLINPFKVTQEVWSIVTWAQLWLNEYFHHSMFLFINKGSFIYKA